MPKKPIKNTSNKLPVYRLTHPIVGWREGQFQFNYLEWLLKTGKAPANQNDRLADTFHLSDEEYDKYYKEFIDLCLK